MSFAMQTLSFLCLDFGNSLFFALARISFAFEHFSSSSRDLGFGRAKTSLCFGWVFLAFLQNNKKKQERKNREMDTFACDLLKFLAMSFAIQTIAGDCGCDAVVHSDSDSLSGERVSLHCSALLAERGRIQANQENQTFLRKGPSRPDMRPILLPISSAPLFSKTLLSFSLPFLDFPSARSTFQHLCRRAQKHCDR